MASDALATERSRWARERAEEALVRLLHELGTVDLPLVVLGGLVPEILTRGQEPPVPLHLGTTDVDLLINLDTQHDLAPLEGALARLDATPQTESRGWRWIATVRGTPVKLEFLCELDQEPEGAIVPAKGCRELATINLRGTGYVRLNPEVRRISGPAGPEGQDVDVEAAFASLGGYLLAKAFALRNRGYPRDYYDFVYVLLYNRLGGPREAARDLRRGPLAMHLSELELLWPEIEARYVEPQDVGPRGYAEQARAVDPSLPIARLRRDAVQTIQEFLRALREETP